MRRGVILVVPLKVFADLGLVLWPEAAFFRADRSGYRHTVLDRLGACLAAIQACDRWWEDLLLDAVLFRFQSNEDSSTMPDWPEWSEPLRVRYNYEPGVRATLLNAYFPVSEIDKPDCGIGRPRRLVSLEG